MTLCKYRLAVDDNDNDYNDNDDDDEDEDDDDDDDEDGGSVKSECRSSHLNEPRKLGSKATLGTASAWGYQFTFSQCGTALSTISPKYKCFCSLNKRNGYVSFFDISSKVASNITTLTEKATRISNLFIGLRSDHCLPFSLYSLTLML